MQEGERPVLFPHFCLVQTTSHMHMVAPLHTGLVTLGWVPAWARSTESIVAWQALRDGSAMAKFREMVEGQGGDVNMIDRHTDPSWHLAASVMPVAAGAAGVVKSIDALSTPQATGRVLDLIARGVARPLAQVG